MLLVANYATTIGMAKRKSEITKYREENGMTLEAFGALLKQAVDKSTVLRWEKASPPAWRALQIEKATGIRREKLIPHLFAETVERPKRKQVEVAQ